MIGAGADDNEKYTKDIDEQRRMLAGSSERSEQTKSQQVGDSQTTSLLTGIIQLEQSQ